MGAGTPLPYLKAWRQKRALSPKYLELRSGIKRQTIWGLERGRTARSDTIEMLARALHISPEELVSVRPVSPGVRVRKNPPITPEALRFALDWYRRVS